MLSKGLQVLRLVPSWHQQHVTARRTNFHKYIHGMRNANISSHTIPQIYRNANAIKTKERETRTTDRKSHGQKNYRKKNLKHPPWLAGDVLVMYEFLQFATVSFHPFTFKSKAAPPNCASMWVTFSWSSDGSWEPLTSEVIMSTKSCDVHPGRKARHVFDRYTSIQSRMTLAVEAKANGTKQHFKHVKYPCIHKSAGVLSMVLLDNMDKTGPNRLSLSFRHNPLKPMHSKPPLAFALQKARSLRFFHCSLPVQHKRTTLP